MAEEQIRGRSERSRRENKRLPSRYRNEEPLNDTTKPPERHRKQPRIAADDGTDVHEEELHLEPEPAAQKAGRQNIAKRDLHRRRSWNEAQNKRRKIQRKSRVASQEPDCAEEHSGLQGDDDGNA